MRRKSESLLDEVPYFDWDAPRAREGYYRIQAGTAYAIARGKAFAPHCDLLWMETAKPILSQATVREPRVAFSERTRLVSRPS